MSGYVSCRTQRKKHALVADKLAGTGSGWPNKHSTLLAMLLRQHSSRHLRRRLHRYRTVTNRGRGTSGDAE